MNRRRLALMGARMALEHSLAAAGFRAGKPVKVTFQISPTCNLRCLHCGIWENKRDPKAMRREEWIAALRGLRRWAGPFALGFRSGEPLMEPDFLPLVAEASALGVMTTCVSNGTLVTEDMARRLKASGLDSLLFSLDGMHPETHDLSRGVPGTHAKVLEAIARLQRLPGAPVLKINSIVAGHNLEELESLVRWTVDRGLGGISLQPLRAAGADWQALWPKDPGRAAEVLDRLIVLKRAGAPILNPTAQLEAMKAYFRDPAGEFPDVSVCGAYTNLNIMGDGTVYFCTYKAPVGNLRVQSIAEIWNSGPALERREEILTCKKSCILLNCHYRPGLSDRVRDFSRSWNAGAGPRA